MKFSSVKIKNFRNIYSLQLEFHSGLNLFIGQNGQGKTNLLEALYLSINGNSFRPATSINFIGKAEPEGSFIEVQVDKRNLISSIETKIEKSKKTHLLNKKRTSGSGLVKSFPCVLFSPESLGAIKDGPEQRRILVDELLVIHDPQNSLLISDFRKCLRSRNKILKSYVKGESDKKQTLLMLESLEKTFLDLSVQLSIKRIQALSDISEDLNKAIRSISHSEEIQVKIHYLISDENSIDKAQREIRESLFNRMRQLLNAELSYGSSLVGPHKHDIRFVFNDQDSRYYCSQGQQRALILAFKLAQIIYHYKIHNDYPVLMLDDVLSELDLDKRKKLIEFLKEVNSQIFVTTTDLSSIELFLTESVSLFSLEDGKVKKN